MPLQSDWQQPRREKTSDDDKKSRIKKPRDLKSHMCVYNFVIFQIAIFWMLMMMMMMHHLDDEDEEMEVEFARKAHQDGLGGVNPCRASRFKPFVISC